MATTEQTPVEGFAIGGLTDDWARHLRAKNVSKETIKSYLLVARNFVGYLADQGMPQAAVSITREHIEAFFAHRLEIGRSDADTAKHYRSLQQLFKWLVDDGEISHDPMARMSPPIVPEQPVPIISDQDLAALLQAGSGKTFENRMRR
jgi:site-specific recombinase XerD